jgi:hypothetical protein
MQAKKHFRLLVASLALLAFTATLPVFAQAPPPPSHSQLGNQSSPSGTGCKLDRRQSIMLALVLGLGYAGLALYNRGKKREIKKLQPDNN